LIVGKDITDKVIVEKELSKSQKKFKVLSENVPGVIYAGQYKTGKMLYVNDNIEHLSGYKKEDFLSGKITLVSLMHPDDRDIVSAEFEKCLEIRSRFRHVYRIKHSNGFWKWIEETSIAVQDNGNGIVIEGFLYDITNIKLIENALRESEEKFRTLSENSAVGVYIIENFVYKYVNPALTKIFGYDNSDEIINKLTLKDIVHPVDFDKVSESISLRLTGNLSSIHYEHLIVKKNKEVANVEVHGSSMILENRPVIIGTLIDITERKKNEELLNIRRDLAVRLSSVNDLDSALQMILEATIQIGHIDCGCVFKCDEDNNIKLVCYNNLSDLFVKEIKIIEKSSKWYEMMIKGQIIYKPYKDLIKYKEDIDLINQEGLKSIIVIPIKNENKRISNFLAVGSHCDDNFSKMIINSLETIAGQVGGVISRLEVEKALKLNIQKLEKMVFEKEALLREIHHRVKNNLQVVSSLLGLQIRSIDKKNNTIIDLFKEAQDRIYSMSLIHEKLYQNNDFSKVNLVKYTEDLIQQLMISYNIQPNLIAVEKNIRCTSLDISVAVPLGLIINEVVSNIFKHAFPGGRSGKIKIHLGSKDSEFIELGIVDDGIGISNDIDFEKVNSFGLHLVYVLAKPFNGILELKRNGDHGTIFKFLIPKKERMYGI
jgi:PAS domain S-box-containing protein